MLARAIWSVRAPTSIVRSSSSGESVLLSWDVIIHTPEEQVLVCQECRVAIPETQISSHLDYFHRSVPAT